MTNLVKKIHTVQRANETVTFTHTGWAAIEKLLTIDGREYKSLETAFSFAICRQSGDKWQSKTLFLTIFDLRLSIILTFSIAAYPVWYTSQYKCFSVDKTARIMSKMSIIIFEATS